MAMTREPMSDEELERRVGRRVFLVCLVSFPAVAAINASSLWTDAVRAGAAIDPRQPWLLELTSVAAMIALVPLVILLERRFPLTPGNLARSLAMLAAGSVAFSLLHVAGMTLLRALLVPAVLGESYRFFDDPLTDLVYEYRKDLFPYAGIVAIATLSRSVEESRREAEAARAEARETGRLMLKSGGRTLFIDAGATVWARAAGNYAEIRAAGRTYLPRISLTALEEQLREAGVDMVRVHRSHIVNRAAIAEIVPTSDGDFRVVLGDGEQIRGSRRYRDRIDTPDQRRRA